MVRQNLSRDQDAAAPPWNVGESAFGHAEVLSKNLFRNVGQKVRDQKGLVLIEVAVVEYEQEFRSFSIESPDSMRDAAREVPDVSLAHIVLEGMALIIDSGDAHPAIDHEALLVWLVPMHLGDRATLEPHVGAVEHLGNPLLSTGRLPRPSVRF